MKKVIKYLLNRIPRRHIQRIAGWAAPLAGRFLRGRRFRCPVCGAGLRRLLPYGYVTPRENALCPNCLALERHRLLWLYLRRETDFFARPHRTLHIAPEACFLKRFEKMFARMGAAQHYVTADLESPLAQVKMDVQQIPFPDASFEVIFCNHILEHVIDDRLAMREMYRVMRPGGWGILLSPVDPQLEKTFEDDTVTDPAERTRIFGQYDHRRNYGRDYADRLRESGFRVEELDYAARFTPEEAARYALRPETIYLVRKPASV